MKTHLPKLTLDQAQWHVIDANGAPILFLLAVQIADTLRGKSKPVFTPHLDAGDFVVVIKRRERSPSPAKKRPENSSMTYSGWKGGERYKSVAHILAIIRKQLSTHAVGAWSPKNRSARAHDPIEGLPRRQASAHPRISLRPRRQKVITLNYVWQKPRFLGTGRRKTLHCPRRIASCSGKITVNGLPFETLFPHRHTPDVSSPSRSPPPHRRQVPPPPPDILCQRPGGGAAVPTPGRRRPARHRPRLFVLPTSILRPTLNLGLPAAIPRNANAKNTPARARKRSSTATLILFDFSRPAGSTLRVFSFRDTKK